MTTVLALQQLRDDTERRLDVDGSQLNVSSFSHCCDGSTWSVHVCC
jgi:hypothetical protein